MVVRRASSARGRFAGPVRSTVRHTTPVHAQDVRMPYAVCHMGSAHGLELRCLFSVFLRTPCFSVCVLLAHEISHADALRSKRMD